MVNPEIRVGIDVGSKAHRVEIAGPDREILEEFVISHNQQGPPVRMSPGGRWPS